MMLAIGSVVALLAMQTPVGRETAEANAPDDSDTETSRPDPQFAVNRDGPSPALEPLRGLPIPPSGPLDLSDVATTGSERNRLRLRLPAGFGACELTAEAPPENGHAVVWKPRLGERFTRGRLIEVPAGEQTWELSTDDGRRQYFYGVEVATHLHCDGTLHWRNTAHGGDTPWLVDVGRLLGHRPDPSTPADRFFERTRFFNSRGEPLRPMRRDARLDVAPGDWVRELGESTLADYMTSDGNIRFWGRVKRIRWVELSGQPIERRWHDRLESYE
ncbi:hypothetical protein [Modicisalibacter radicis]|uniref:hypothetical protein n=1 Tax=Halomonas sp. EAR18 TaxID=2518972 RepID=UPI00109D62BD|nr:hypothetical protein [Halomonas sp. EAR18]